MQNFWLLIHINKLRGNTDTISLHTNTIYCYFNILYYCVQYQTLKDFQSLSSGRGDITEISCFETG